MVRREQITAIVLCGGSAARLGTVDKTLLEVGGRPLVEHTIEALRPQVGSFVLSCGRDPRPYRELGYPVVADGQPGDGPLGGIVSALSQVDTAWILTCPGDMPFPDAALVKRLAPAAEHHGLAVPRTGTYRQHLVMLIRHDRAVGLAAYYARNGRAAREWLDEVAAAEVDMDHRRESFFNVNTPADLAAAERRLAEIA